MELHRDDPTRPPGGADRHGRTCRDPRLRHRHPRTAAAQTIAAADRPDAPGLRSATEGAGGARAPGRGRLIVFAVAPLPATPSAATAAAPASTPAAQPVPAPVAASHRACCGQCLQPGHLADPVGELRQPVAGPGALPLQRLPHRRRDRPGRAGLLARRIRTHHLGQRRSLVLRFAERGARGRQQCRGGGGLPADHGAAGRIGPARPDASCRASAT